jgi:hypothetical protein
MFVLEMPPPGINHQQPILFDVRCSGNEHRRLSIHYKLTGTCQGDKDVRVTRPITIRWSPTSSLVTSLLCRRPAFVPAATTMTMSSWDSTENCSNLIRLAAAATMLT